jgi:hypothetical protein
MTKPKAAHVEPRGMVLKGDRVHPEHRDGGPDHLARKTQRLFERLAREHGDHCMGCGRPYRDQDRTQIGYAVNNKPMMVGACCGHRLVSALASTIYRAPEGLPPWQADDAAWFDDHPERSFRLRASWPGEWAADSIEPCTIVRQQEPGQRLRTCVERVRELLPTDPPDAVLWAMVDLLTEARERGQTGMITMEAIRERSLQLATRGSA